MAMDIRRGFRIGPWSVSPLTGEIASNGQSVHLEPKVMEVLVVLAEQPESVVLRDELLEKVWGARAAISDEPLTRCIAQLRQSFGDSSRDPRFIQTLPKRGYRLMVPVEPIEATPDPAASGQAVRPSPRESTRGDALHLWQRVGLVVALASVGVISYFALPLIMSADESEWLDSCQIETVEQPFRVIDDRAYALCTEGVEEMRERTVASLGFAMDSFWRAIEIEPNYGSAIVNLARSMVLLPSYQDFPDPRDCSYDNSAVGQAGCYEAALKLLDLYISDVPYIESYVYGIKGYIYSKQHEWPLAAVMFERAVNDRRNDSDMWQWYSQFYAGVGSIESALEAIQQAYQLNPDSGVVLDRYGVILMWLERDDEAALRFGEAAQFPHVPYEASHLVWSIRNGQWEDVRRLLEQHAGPGRTGAAWIDDFFAGLSDETARGRAIAAVEAAIQANDLSGQYIYGAWALLGEPARAIDAARRMLEDHPEDMSIEFLFAPETRELRQHDGFIEIVRMLGLDSYWSANPANCPSLFERPGERNWCN